MKRGFPPPVHELKEHGREGFADWGLAAGGTIAAPMEGHAGKVEKETHLVALDVNPNRDLVAGFGEHAHAPCLPEALVDRLMHHALYRMLGRKTARMGSNLVDDDADVLAEPILPANGLRALKEGVEILRLEGGEAYVNAVGGAEA